MTTITNDQAVTKRKRVAFASCKLTKTGDLAFSDDSDARKAFYENQNRYDSLAPIGEYLAYAFGRMYWKNMGDSVYPFVPNFLGFSRAESFEQKKVKKENTRKEIIKESISEQEKNEAIKKALTRQLQTMLGKDISYEVLQFINSEGELDRSSDSDFQLKNDLHHVMSSFVAETIQKLENTELFKKVRIPSKKKIKIIDEPFYVDVLEFKFIVPPPDHDTETEHIFIVRLENEAATIISLLLPLIEKAKAKIEQIRKWRTNGVPIEERDYTPVSKFKPFEYQWVMYKVGMLLDKSANLSEMGTGKTFGTIMVVDKRIQNGDVQPGSILVVAPPNALENWENEFKLHAPHLKTEILEGSYMSRAQKILDQESDTDVFIANYEMFSMKYKHKQKAQRENEETGKMETFIEVKEIPLSMLCSLRSWEMVILDEAHKIKNPDAKRTQAIISAFKDIKYSIIMSGTINANKLYDLHPPFVFLNNARQFNSVLTRRDGSTLLELSELNENFKTAHYYRDGWNLSPRPGTIREHRQRLEEVSIRYEKSECLDLPAKMYEAKIVQMTEEQEKIYKALQTKLLADMSEIIDAGGRITVMNILAMMMKLSEVANGWIYTEDKRAINLPRNPKLDALCEVAEDIGDDNKAVVWARFTQDLHLIADRFKKLFGEDAIAVIHGGESCSVCGSRRKERFEITQEFNQRDSKLRFVICNQAVGAHAINLTGATYEFYFSNSFSKTDRAQSEDRCHRSGMREKLTIIDFIARNTIDETILDAFKGWKNITKGLLEHLGITPEKVGIENLKDDDAPVIKEVEHQNQGSKPDCVLASVAMLSEKSIHEIKEWAIKYATLGSEWRGEFKHVTYVLREFLGEQVANEWLKFEGKNEQIKLVPADIKVPLKGKGLLLIANNGVAYNHMVAYANGKIHDPHLIDGMDIPRYYRYLSNTKTGSINAIIKVVEEGEKEKST